MAFKIDSEICTACGACKDDCPVDAINAGDVYHIDEDTCIDCGACEGSCPANAIHD
jgi:NAD-dependent dihydropyrimidine dehydrogenase PreA subunit